MNSYINDKDVEDFRKNINKTSTLSDHFEKHANLPRQSEILMYSRFQMFLKDSICGTQNFEIEDV